MSEREAPPEAVWLQPCSRGTFDVGHDATWCDHPINDDDPKYVRVSEIVEALRLKGARYDDVTQTWFTIAADYIERRFGEGGEDADS